MKITGIGGHLAAAMLLAAPGTWAQSSIMKCQDAEGNWHYGNFAAQECAKSVVEELSESGRKVGETAPPPSAEELAAREAKAAAQDQQVEDLAAQRKKDEELLHIYGSEDVILSTRDRKLASIDKNIDVTQQIKEGILKDIGTLRAKEQSEKVKKLIAERERAIRSYDAVISQNQAERDKLFHKYSDILLQFRAATERLDN